MFFVVVVAIATHLVVARASCCFTCTSTTSSLDAYERCADIVDRAACRRMVLAAEANARILFNDPAATCDAAFDADAVCADDGDVCPNAGHIEWNIVERGDCYEAAVPEMMRCRQLGAASIQYSTPTRIEVAFKAYVDGERYFRFDESAAACQQAIAADGCRAAVEAYRCYVAVRPCSGFRSTACGSYLADVVRQCPTAVAACGIIDGAAQRDIDAMNANVTCPTPRYVGKRDEEADAPPYAVALHRAKIDAGLVGAGATSEFVPATDDEDDDGVVPAQLSSAARRAAHVALVASVVAMATIAS